MNTAENKRSVFVGIFVLISIAILVAGIFTLGGQQNRFEETIRLKAAFDDVEGLRKGNNVWFSGIKVGNVREIRFNEGSLNGGPQLEVVMHIEQGAQKYIRKDARVKLSSDGLIGNRILTITGGSTAAPAVEDGDLLATETGLSTDDMMATLQENNENLVSITNNLKELTSSLNEGEGTAGALLKDTQMADNFRATINDLQQVASNTVRATGALTQFTSKLNSSEGLANQLLTDTVVFSQLKTSAEQLQETLSAAEIMTKNLTEASNKVLTTNNGIGILLNDEQFGTQLKNTMQNLETSTEKLDENMEALQHNFLFRGFFRKRAKEEARQQQ
ncbi:MlaD family protein [Cesiribacter sp. SM1]|uniref:MlaD family protein n=1 Tax=Cesiribacter sp. SM1 TaxID=2861196 RepID=UPI001CD24956|nr:MlaD family protein [Cesiribacter sp. SM1]